MEVSHGEIEIFDLFRSRELDLDPMTFIYECDLYSYRRLRTACANMNFLSQCFRKLSSDRQDRQTDGQKRPKLYITPLRGWSNINSNYNTNCCFESTLSTIKGLA